MGIVVTRQEHKFPLDNRLTGLSFRKEGDVYSFTHRLSVSALVTRTRGLHFKLNLNGRHRGIKSVERTRRVRIGTIKDQFILILMADPLSKFLNHLNLIKFKTIFVYWRLYIMANKTKSEVQVALESAREAVKSAKAVLKELTAKRKEEMKATKAARVEAATVRKAEREKRMATIVAKRAEKIKRLEEMVAKMKGAENVGKGNKARKAATRKPGAVTVIKPAA